MSCSLDNAIPSLLFEHACKNSYNNTIAYILNNEDFTSQVISSCSSSEDKQVKPVFIFINLLKKLNSLNILSNIDSIPEELSNILSVIIDLLETTYRQYNFISLKKFFTFLSELKLLDLLSLIVKNVESPKILQKLNQHFPRWSSSYKETVEKNYNIENSKILDKVEESHAQCRRLILKLAVDLTFRAKYMTEQYTNDVDRIVKESICYIKEAINALDSCAGSSLLETVVKDEENVADGRDLSVQLLFEYVQPEITDDGLVKFLEDLEPSLNSQPTASALTSCLSPFDSLSEDEDSDLSESEYELSQSGCHPINGS
uniref:Uncharacterized protein n=2 Tax=Parasteatoda tepidariorum TaxID=114398 RepID=A0A2L2YDZ3_PARTP